MGKKVKSYLAFTSPLYRIAVYLLIPAGIVGIGLWAGRESEVVGVIFVAVLLPVAEVLSDSWLFGGIQAKDAVKLDYLKTSGQGMRILRSALILDLVRKFITALGTILICYLVLRAAGRYEDEIDIAFSRRGMMGMSGWEEATLLLFFVLVSYLASVVGTFLSRYGGMIWLNLTIGYCAAVFAALCMFLLMFLNYMFILDVFFCVLILGVGILTVRTAMRKVEGGGYDQ